MRHHERNRANSMNGRDSHFELEVHRHFGSALYFTVSFPSALENKARTVHIQMRKYTLIVTLPGTKELGWTKA